MSRQKQTLLTAIAIVALTLVCFAKNQKLSGKIVAYDLMKHNAKNTSALQNQEVVILAIPANKLKYVKVVFSTFGTTQIDQKYFDGNEPLEVNVFRDKGCDERAPRFVTQVSVEQMAGTYLLTDAFKTSPPPRMKTLECYDAIPKKR